MFLLTPPKDYRPASSVFQNFKLALGLGVYGKGWDVNLMEEVKAEIVKAGD